LKDLIYKEESYNVIGACFEVHKELGNGFLEAVYQEALEIELRIQKIPFEREKTQYIYYKEKRLNKRYVPDFVCYDKIIVEIKALSQMSSDAESQVLNYLKTTGYKVGILVNFGKQSLDYKRFVY